MVAVVMLVIGVIESRLGWKNVGFIIRVQSAQTSWNVWLSSTRSAFVYFRYVPPLSREEKDRSLLSPKFSLANGNIM